jgi:hypothetical protein
MKGIDRKKRREALGISQVALAFLFASAAIPSAAMFEERMKQTVPFLAPLLRIVTNLGKQQLTI